MRTRGGVRKHFPNDRLIAKGKPDGYVEPVPVEPFDPPPLPPCDPPVTEVRRCPSCGKQVRYNLRTGIFYGHTLPRSTTACFPERAPT